MLKRKSIHSIEEVRKAVTPVMFIQKKKDSRIIFDGDEIKGNSQRYQTFFTKGIDCVRCGVKGKYFAKEKNFKDNRWHLNLYALDKNGKEVLMTKAHIVPPRKGGKNHISNYQPMCEKCNVDKGLEIINYLN